MLAALAQALVRPRAVPLAAVRPLRIPTLSSDPDRVTENPKSGHWGFLAGFVVGAITGILFMVLLILSVLSRTFD
jgi:hypothetical protein